MIFFKKMCLVLITALSISACSIEESNPPQQFYVFGTLVGVTVWGAPKNKTAEAINMVSANFQSMHERWHAWNPSEVTALNQALAAGESYIVKDEELLMMLKQAQHLAQQSDHLFNPAIGHLIALWGFQQTDLAQTPPPEDTAIAALVTKQPMMADLIIEGNQVSSKNPAVKVDLGAFAKGYAIDVVMDKLKNIGIKNAIINAGGNLKAMGRIEGRAWRIGVRHPSGKGVIAAIETNGEESVITSGDYERFREYEGKRYSHILDPRTGYSATGISSVTVLDKSGAFADAASTALTVAGLDNWHAMAKQLGVKHAMVIDAVGKVYVTPNLAARVFFDPDNKPEVIITEPLSKSKPAE